MQNAVAAMVDSVCLTICLSVCPTVTALDRSLLRSPDPLAGCKGASSWREREMRGRYGLGREDDEEGGKGKVGRKGERMKGNEGGVMWPSENALKCTVVSCQDESSNNQDRTW